MFKQSSLVRALDAWGMAFASIFNETVNQINTQVLPHLRINNYMGRFFQETPKQTYDRFVSEQLLASGGDPELYDYIKAVMAGDVYPTYRLKHGKPIPVEQAEWNALGFSRKPGFTHDLDQYRRCYILNNKRDNYFTKPTKGDMRFVRCLPDGSVVMEECTPRGFPDIHGGDWVFNGGDNSNLPIGWHFFDSLNQVLFCLPNDRQQIRAYTQATLELNRPWVKVDVQEALDYCDVDQYIANLRCLGPGLNPELLRKRIQTALRIVLSLIRDTDQKGIHSEHFTTYFDWDDEGNVTCDTKHQQYRSHLDKSYGFVEYVDLLVNDTLDGHHPLYSLYARIGDYIDTRDNQTSGSFWERVYKGFQLVEVDFTVDAVIEQTA